jgi:hypothetical protein
MGRMHMRERLLQPHGNREFDSEPGRGLGGPRSIYEIGCDHIRFRQACYRTLDGPNAWI